MKGNKLLIVAVCLFWFSITILNTSHAETIVYDFSGGIGVDFGFSNPDGLFTLDDSGGELRLSKVEDSLPDPGHPKRGTVYSNFTVSGDFEISVEYNLNSALGVGDQIEFQIWSNDFAYFISRSNEDFLGGNNYHVFWNDGDISQTAILTSDTSGTFRFIRKGATIWSYFKSSSSSEYTLIHSKNFGTSDIGIGMTLQNQPHSFTALDGTFDNLIIMNNEFPWTMFLPAIIAGAEDCNGIKGGGAYIDNCGICVGGTTESTPCSQDCNDVWGGNAEIDECGVCGGGGPPCPVTSLGKFCSDDCNGSFCQSSGPSISTICTDSDLAMPCVGTATGMFCSKSCTNDSDCANQNNAMKCLTSCPDYPDLAGRCLVDSDHTWMVDVMCPE
ncbi:MAG: hypothetical protein GY705_07305 [Bacteroidetes bacterium]|nr:hypothetical protein [Bacteroidota bacterium]